jgi:hypothetical protein
MRRSFFQSLTTKHRQVLAVLVSYCFAWGFFFLIPDAVFWDDWLFVNDEVAGVNHFLQVGAPWATWFHTTFGHSVQLYRFFTFASFLLAAFLFLGLLRLVSRDLNLSDSQVLVASVLFAILPLNLARVVSSSSKSLCEFQSDIQVV